MKYSKSNMKSIIENNSFKFKKKFGQKFITDENIINNIVSNAQVDRDTLVIEIGPGAGSLTYKLVKTAGFVLCYEIDKSVDKILKDNLKDFNNYEVIYDDFLKRNIKEDINNYEYNKLYVVANLPYYITTPIIIKLIEEKLNIDKIVVMVQKEVGDRFKAKPNTKEYNSLSIFINYYFNVEKILDVSKNVFIPKPNVDSIVVSFTKKQLKPLKDEHIFFKLIKDAFKQKRKTLKNNLNDYDLEKVEEVLNKHNLNLSVRAEAIPIDIFIEIANNL